MTIAGRGFDDGGGSLPAFVERAHQDVQWQAALRRVGYRRIRSAYARQMRDSPHVEIFYGIQHLHHWPTMEFVRGWLKLEKKRVMARVRWTFVSAMLATILAGITFMAALSMLHLEGVPTAGKVRAQRH